MRFLSTLAATVLSLPLIANAFGTDIASCASTPMKDHPVTTHIANGPFDVKLSVQPMSEVAEHSGIGRMSLDKRFHGALEATSVGEMIAFRSATAGSAGYVAMETVRGTLDGRTGSFVLQHSSTMNRGEPTQSITVVPDSGTEALIGINGRMIIDVAPGGAHAYRFEYSLAGEAAK